MQRKPAKSQGRPWLFCFYWEQRKLGDVGKARSGVGFPDAEQGGASGIPFFKVSDMNIVGNENEMTVANNYVTDAQIASHRWSSIEELPAVFFAKVGAAVMLNRKRLCRFPFLLDNNTMAYSLGKEHWNADFAKALFETVDLTSLVQVGALPSYNAGDVEAMEIMLPEVPEQQQIGAFFRQLDNLTVDVLTDNYPINLTKANDVLNYEVFTYFDQIPGSFYPYYPYLISMGDLTFYNVYRNMKEGNPISSKEDFEKLLHIYTKINYQLSGKNYKTEIPIACTHFDKRGNLAIKVGSNVKQKVKVAVANAVLFESDFENILKDTPNRSYTRYRNIMKVINEALQNHSDLLVMPENFLPFEWLPIIARTCAKNQMAVVSGIEHVKLKNINGEDVVYNLTASILPYQEGSYKFA